MEEKKEKQSLYERCEAGIETSRKNIKKREKKLLEIIESQTNPQLQNLMVELYDDPTRIEFLSPDDLYEFGPALAKFVKKILKFYTFLSKSIERYKRTQDYIEYTLSESCYFPNPILEDYIKELTLRCPLDEWDIELLSYAIDDILDDLIFTFKNEESLSAKVKKQLDEDGDSSTNASAETKAVDEFLKKKSSNDEQS